MSSATGIASPAPAAEVRLRLRLGLLAPQFPPGIGGMQELAFGLAGGLARHDDVTVYTVPGQGAPGAPFEVREVLSKKSLPANLEVLRREEPEVDVWLAMDAGLAPLAVHARRPFFTYFHGNDFLSPGYDRPGEWGALLAGRPVVWRFARRVKRLQRRRLLRRSLPAVREIFTNSRSTARLIDRTYPSHGRTVTIIPPGVSDAFFQPHPPAPPGPLRIVTISRLTRQAKRKNVEGVLRALRLVAEATPVLDFRYTIVGDGNDRARLEGLAGELGLAPRVRFAGFVTREALLTELREADVFVLASQASAYDVEGFGMVYIEAAASGVPVIGSAEGGAVDAIEPGTSGVLIDRSTPEAIADGLRRFHAERARYTSEAARGFAEQFRWPAVADRLRARIDRQLAPGRRA